MTGQRSNQLNYVPSHFLWNVKDHVTDFSEQIQTRHVR